MSPNDRDRPRRAPAVRTPPRSPAEVEVGDTVRLKTDGPRLWCVTEVITKRSQEMTAESDPHDALWFEVVSTSEFHRTVHTVRACELDLAPPPAAADDTPAPEPAAVECADGRRDPDF